MENNSPLKGVPTMYEDLTITSPLEPKPPSTLSLPTKNINKRRRKGPHDH